MRMSRVTPRSSRPTRSSVARARVEPLEPRQLFSGTAGAVTSAQLNADAAYAYQYAYPLAYQYLSEQVGTDVAKPQGFKAPVNQLSSLPLAPIGSPNEPNADTLYSAGWLDLSNQPVVLHVPNTNGRYYTFELTDAWTNVFAVIGKPTTGTAVGNFAIVGPDFTGALPAGVQRIDAPTNQVQLLGRTLVVGSSDLKAAQAVQAKYTLTPLNDYGKKYTPPSNVPVQGGVNTTTPVLQQINALSGTQFFSLVAQALKVDSPLLADVLPVKWLEAIGVTPGQSFNASTLSAAQGSAVAQSVAAGQSLIAQSSQTFAQEARMDNGWQQLQFDVGNYGTNYADRAAAVVAGDIEANLPQDAIYPSIADDSAGNALTGQSNYTITFPKGGLPPASDFWSLTLYNASDGSLYANSLNRYEIGNRTPYKLNADGSLTIYISHDEPATVARQANWLPAPAGNFKLVLRLYGPSNAALRGTWTPPSVINTGLSQEGLNAAATQAYQYLYPLVYQSISERVQTDVSAPDGANSLAPVNQLFNNPLAPLNNNTGPNADTLYTGGWLDLTNGPIVLHVPNFNGRFYSFELANAWTNTFKVIGKDTTGTAAADFAIVGPGWKGTLPQGVQKVQSPTDLVAFLGRTLVYGSNDLQTANALRNKFSLTPLADYGKHYTPPGNVPYDPFVDTTTPIATQVAALSPTQFFTVAAQGLKGNPSLSGDGPAIQWLKDIGLTPGADFLASKLSAAQSAAVQQAVSTGQTLIKQDAITFERSGPVTKTGWFGLPADLVDYGTNYADRAGAASVGAFTLANPRSEALYLSAVTDSTGQALNGNNDYEVTFKAGQFPPSLNFWSLTLYQQNAQLYPNALNKFAIGNRSPYKLNADGSLTIYIGHTSPGADKESNWLPAPAAGFILTIRIYGPEQSALDNTWQPPLVQRVQSFA
ncbi:MAG: hypothetical protein JWN24_1446 [Phycisphaerales bacterium]|nr:hypothetical protein [Phycisphaerales bacterium]